MLSHVPELLERGRQVDPRLGPGAGFYGYFLIYGPCTEILKIVSSAGTMKEEQGWEHVSVSTRRRTPNWREMCFVKSLFWDPQECVVQFHPPESDYVNNHAYCLHLWRNRLQAFPLPPADMVGIKGEGLLTPARALELRQRHGLMP